MSEAIPLPKNPVHQRFADLVLGGMPAPEAYRQVGFKPKNPGSASSCAGRLLKNVEVVRYLAAVRGRAAAGTVATMQQKRELLYRIMFTPIMAIDPHDPERRDGDLIKKYRRVTTETGEVETIEKYDAMKAMDLDNKLSGDDPEAKALGDLAGVLARLAPASVLPNDKM